MITFTIRNVKLFFRDQGAVFFSLLAVLIVVALYALFLGDIWANSFEDMEYADYFMSSWLAAGLVSVASLTTTLGAFSAMIEDRVKKIDKDFYSSPVKRSSITGGYILGAFVVGAFMSLVTLILAEIYVIMNGGELLALGEMLLILGAILLATLANTSIICFISVLIKTQSSFSALNTIIGTLSGFLMGIYIPIGELPEAVRTVLKYLPFFHTSSLIRRIMTDEPLKLIFQSVPEAYRNEMQEIQNFMGITVRYGEQIAPAWLSVVILLLTVAVFFTLSVLVMSRKKKS